MRSYGPLYAAIGVALIGCGNPPMTVIDEPDGPPAPPVEDWRTGRYALVQFNEEALPARVYQLPSDRVTHAPSPCWIMMREGSLEFTTESVVLRYVMFSSCTGVTTRDATVIGELVKVDSSFLMILRRGEDEPLVSEGRRLTDGRVLLRQGDWRYLFQRPTGN
jgi:hypothetical protein